MLDKFIEELDRIKELQRNEELLYNCIDYLEQLWVINATNIEEKFKNIGFKEEDLKRLEIVDLDLGGGENE